MATFATAKELSAYLRKVTVSQYEPLPSSIHTVLQRHGIKPITKDYNGRLVKVYDVKNAKRIISQYMYELKKEDALTNNVKDIMKHNSENVSNTSMPKPQYIPRKHGETNAMRELDRETLYEGKRIYITEEQFKKLVKRGFVNEMAFFSSLTPKIGIYVWPDDNGEIPHFHILDVATRGNAFDSCLMYTDNRYFSHGKHQGKLNSKLRKELNNLLSKSYNGKYSVWEQLIILWNSFSHKVKLPLDLPKPDYSFIKPYK